MLKVIFPGRVFEEMKKALAMSGDSESGCFLLVHRYGAGRKGRVVTVTGLVWPGDESWDIQGEHSLKPSSTYINRAAMTADGAGCGLVFVHTHPSTLHPPTFSSIDEDTNSRLLPNLAEILPGAPIGSFVLSRSGLHGIVLEGGRFDEVTSARVNGRTILPLVVAGKSTSKRIGFGKVDRQVKAIGEKAQRIIATTTVAIVGAGGTGSAVAAQLARMGVGKLLVVDMDSVDESNLSRVYGACPSDVGKPKVTVVKRHVESFSDTKVEAIVADVTKSDLRIPLAEADVIFGCTDNLASRSVLNDISLQDCIPLIDIGCRIQLANDRSIAQAVTKVQVVTPDDSCLWCTGTLEGKAILQESLSEDEKEKLEKEGYYEPTARQPSIISLTSLAATIGVNKFLSLLGVFGNDYPTRTQIELRSDFLISDSPKVREGCVCEKRRGVGDCRQIAFPSVARGNKSQRGRK